jgi:glucose/arabinose dehydrogenase
MSAPRAAILVLLAAAGVLLGSCGSDEAPQSGTTAAGDVEALQAVSTVEPPEDADASARRTPRQRRVPFVPLRASRPALFSLELVTENLSEPVYIAATPSEPGRIYVLERIGRVRIVENGELLEEPFLDLSRFVRTEIEEGLHSLVFHPDYPDDPRVFVDYNDKEGDVRVVELRVEDGRPDVSSRRELLAIDKTDGVKWHNGGQLQFGPDDLLYVSMGDSARNPYDNLGPPQPPAADPDNNAQNLRLLFGKLLRLDVDAEQPAPEIAAYGLRNLWRFSFDRENGDLYLADVGQFAWEELSYVPAGTTGLLNFGWSIFEAGAYYNREHELGGAGELVWPILRYGHGPQLYCSIRGSISGGYVYRGEAIPELRGRYVFGDYCSGEIWTTRVVNGKATETRKEPLEVIGLASFGEDAAGELYAASITTGAVYRLAPR